MMSYKKPRPFSNRANMELYDVLHDRSFSSSSNRLPIAKGLLSRFRYSNISSVESMESSLISNPETSSGRLLESAKKKRKKNPIPSKKQTTRWRTADEQQNYSSKLIEALCPVRRDSSTEETTAPPPTGRVVRDAAYRALAFAAKGRTRWSRAILTNRLKLKFRMKKRRIVTGICRSKKQEAMSMLKLKGKKQPALQREARNLGRLVPGCQKVSVPVILEEATDYIAALEMQVRTMEILVEKLEVYETCKKPKLSVTCGDAIHEFKKCGGQIFSKYFQETFLCKVDEEVDFLEVGLWDSHRFTSDELVGSAKVQLHNVTSENFHPFTTQLFSDSGRLVGEVQLKIRLVEASMPHSMPLLAPGGLTRPSVLHDGLPNLRGTEIPSARIRARIGDLYEFKLESCNTLLKEIDSYISMKYGDVVYKTKKSTDGAVFMEFLDRFVCKVDEAVKVLDVDLWKRHRIIPDELVGSAKIELDSVTSGAFHHTTTQLFSKDGRYLGEVRLKVRRVKPSDVNHPLKTYKRGNFHNCTKQ